MDTIKAAAVMIIIGVVFLFLYFSIMEIGKVILLRKHQEEWDKKKAEMIQKGMTDAEMRNEYDKYSDMLFYTAGDFLGACFPRY